MRLQLVLPDNRIAVARQISVVKVVKTLTLNAVFKLSF